MYRFPEINYPGDTFTQLLGINNGNQIAGYDNFNENSGFTLVPPNHFTTENFPGSMMTQVIGINNNAKTVGFTSTRTTSPMVSPTRPLCTRRLTLRARSSTSCLLRMTFTRLRATTA